MPKNKKLALKLGIQTFQILTNNDEVCIPSLSSIFLAVIYVAIKSSKRKRRIIILGSRIILL
jgi:hypothetical protein